MLIDISIPGLIPPRVRRNYELFLTLIGIQLFEKYE
jgi:hypothetical protein